MGEKEETIPEGIRETMGHWRMLRGRTDEKIYDLENTVGHCC